MTMSTLIVRQSVDLAVIALWVLQPDTEQATATITEGKRILGFIEEVSWEKPGEKKAQSGGACFQLWM